MLIQDVQEERRVTVPGGEEWRGEKRQKASSKKGNKGLKIISWIFFLEKINDCF
jgi:hypothetical protein